MECSPISKKLKSDALHNLYFLRLLTWTRCVRYEKVVWGQKRVISPKTVNLGSFSLFPIFSAFLNFIKKYPIRPFLTKFICERAKNMIYSGFKIFQLVFTEFLAFLSKYLKKKFWSLFKLQNHIFGNPILPYRHASIFSISWPITLTYTPTYA